MSEREPSKTALGVAAQRVFHQLFDATPKILDDPVILRLFDPAGVDQIRADPSRFQLPPAVALRAHVVIRNRYTEDRLAQAVKRGIKQYIILGAGLDTFPYRQPEWAHALRIFEVDQSASQQEKRSRLQRGDIEIPDNVEFVPMDFETTALAQGLKASSFDPTVPTFLSWLGVMVYLTQDAADEVFKFAVSLPRTSELVLTFTQPRSEEQESKRQYPGVAERAASVGEPFKTFISKDDLEKRLLSFGFSQVTFPTSAEVDGWYIQGRADGLRAAQRANLASAIV